MNALSDVEMQRAERLHSQSFIWDYSPFGETLVPTLRLEKVMYDGLERGRPSLAVLGDMVEERIGELKHDPGVRSVMQDFWRRAGVSGAAATMMALDSLPGETEPLMRAIEQWHRRIQASDYMTLVTSAATTRDAWRRGNIGIMLALQDATPLSRDLSMLDTLYASGVRIIQLTYNLRNLIGDGCTERTQAGLSHFGVAFVKRMNELGIVVDVSHCGDGTTSDAIEVSEGPIAVTHSFCRSLRAHVRGKTDDQLRRLAERNGFLGIASVPMFLSDEEAPSLEIVLDHVEHAVMLVGAQRVGVCTDWGGWSPDLPEPLRPGLRQLSLRRGFRPEHGMALAARPGGAFFKEMKDYTDWIAFTQGLVSRGYSDDEIRGFLGENWLAFLERAGLP